MFHPLGTGRKNIEYQFCMLFGVDSRCTNPAKAGHTLKRGRHTPWRGRQVLKIKIANYPQFLHKKKSTI